MAGITRFKSENLGSVLKIQAAPVEAFRAFPAKPLITVNETLLQFRAGVTWYDLYCSPQTMGYQMDGKEDGNGKYYEHQVVGFVPGDEPDLEAQWKLYQSQDWILKITLATGRQKLIGTPRRPLTFETSQSTGTTPGDPAGTRITFSGQSMDRSPFLINNTAPIQLRAVLLCLVARIIFVFTNKA
ncbi:MAG: hypothetical protein INR69_15090 [Mucilaginibacter polytrichastri]|nr:hypothetical protein [Mucilaginibacter polytrichastri]